MGPTIINLNIKKTLLNPITIEGKFFTEIDIKKIIIRPVLKKIVFETDLFEKTIIYNGETEFEAHKNESQEDLVYNFLSIIDTKFNIVS